MEIKTITYLNSKAWYRAVKIIYMIFTAGCYAVMLEGLIAFWLFGKWVILLKILIVPGAIFGAWLVSKIPQWIFYYIYFGSTKPQK